MRPVGLLFLTAALAGVQGCATTGGSERMGDDRALARSIVRVITRRGDSSFAYGTGVIVAGRRATYIMTAYHIVAGTRRIWARFDDDAHFPHPLRVAGIDRLFDVAFLSPDPNDSTFTHAPVPLAWGDSRSLDASAFRNVEVKFIGYPGEVRTRHVGRVLASNVPGYLVRRPQPSVILSTVHLNGGASGSALLDDRNRIVGINVSIASTFLSARWAMPTSVSVPSNDLRAVLERIERGVTTEHATLFIDYDDVENLLPERFHNLVAATSARRGVIITGVADSSTARQADLRPGDLILLANGKPVRTAQGLFRTFQTELAPGIPVYLRIMRDSNVLSKTVLPQSTQ